MPSPPLRELPNEAIRTVYQAFGGHAFWDRVQEWDNTRQKTIVGDIVLQGTGFLTQLELTEEEKKRGVTVLIVLDKIFGKEGSEEKSYAMSPYFFRDNPTKKGFRFTFKPECCIPLKELGHKGRSIEAVHEIREMLDKEGKEEILALFRLSWSDREERDSKVAELQEVLDETEKVAGEYIEGRAFVQEAVVEDLFKRALRGFNNGTGIRDALQSAKEAQEDGRISPEHEPTIAKLLALESKMEAFMTQARRESRQVG